MASSRTMSMAAPLAAPLARLAPRRAHALSALRGQVRHIVVGEDGRNWNTVVLMVPQAQEWMIERFGKFNRVAKPGLNFAIPFIEKVAYKRTLKETAVPVEPQVAITRDNVHVEMGGAIYTQVTNPYHAAYNIDQPEYMISTLAQSAMRKEVGNLELDSLFLEREKLNSGIAKAVDEIMTPWGIRVTRYEIADIKVRKSIQEAMERQSNAERLRRAEVLESEGYRQRQVNQSEGDRQAAINKAQGEAQSVKLRAEADAASLKMLAEANAEQTRLLAAADAESIRLRAAAEADRTRLNASATADGLRAVAAALEAPGGTGAMTQRLAEKYVGELAEMSKSAKLVIVPDRPNDVASVVATALGMAEAVQKSAEVATTAAASRRVS